ncbi:MAG: LytTR family transcriptional regulator [Schleiferiaceae bacterium]|jgi:DNA-binding LytR/AlgR family response regulator|nr:LytTR family transcriptional regulator [Schleiferiaceae bacterium]MDP4627219.1 LytTR family transcriptional regulator [Schleiferiaceae bacterium]MDP4727665.1 LytTR family transcriptional regulator [Schleiferiaceae bacterium]MDP4749659.1 LytTR family transcriptional regulator [Schleiferiaceae bacterium]MDP4859261.1 LytTR family transcriptional regulator [Schleiferiaceae bacterium]
MENRNTPHYTFVQLGKNWIRIDLQKISHFESSGDYVRWYETGNQQLKSSSSKITEARLGQLSEQLEAYGFVRVHRRYSVNLRAVEKFDGESLQMESIVIPVGRTRRQHVLARLRSFGLRDDHQTVRGSHPIQVVRSSRQESG